MTAVKKLATLLATGIVVLSAGCSAASPATGVAPAAAPAAAAAAEPTAVQPGPISLALSTTELGETLTSHGWTVYRFEADTPKPPASVCANDCLRAWPPLLTDGTPLQLDGIDPALVGTLNRTDGTVQMTLGGWPLYRFVDDKKPGDTLGENVGGNWSTVGKDGKPLVTK